jgi:hypothetical protein
MEDKGKDKPERGALNYNFDSAWKPSVPCEGFIKLYGFIRVLHAELGDDIVGLVFL